MPPVSQRAALLQGPAAGLPAGSHREPASGGGRGGPSTVGGRRVLLQLMQPVSAAVRASSPWTGSDGAAGSTAWPTALKSEPSTSCTVPERASSSSSTTAPGTAAASVAARVSSPAAYRTTVVS